jgi:hypothetical protein
VETNFLQTKLYIPTLRPSLVLRLPLLAKLDGKQLVPAKAWGPLKAHSALGSGLKRILCRETKRFLLIQQNLL